MASAKITDHANRALEKLIEQYKGKVTVEGLVRALVKPFQTLEDAADTVLNKRWVDDAEGVQLDLFGTIVVQSRLGFDDTFYRVLLKAKIGINNSKGEPKSITNTMKILSQGTRVHYQNLGNGNIMIGTDGVIPDELINFIYSNMERVVMAGVRIAAITGFDADEPFTFDGTGPALGLGFSSLAAPSTGGKLGFLYRRTIPFAFSSVAGASDNTSAGFGTLADNLAGGDFVGL